MMTIHRFLSANSRRVFDRMTMLMPIFRSTLTATQGRAEFRRGGLTQYGMVCAVLIASFAGAQRAQAQATPLPVIVADFNHDGIPDTLATSSTTPTATIAFGTVPYGSFSADAKAVTFPAACTSFDSAPLVVGDFDGDGFPDIAFFCNGSSGVLLGNGDGTFAASKPLAGAISETAVVGDFNKDGKLDLVLLGLTFGPNTTAIGTLQFFAGKGDGTFAAGVNTKLDQTTYSAPLVADLNGDGYPEIILLSVVPGTPPSVNIFGNNQDGTFGGITQGVATANTSATVGTTASTILAGHFFGTNTVDLVVAGTGANGGLSAFQNTSTATSYSFNDPVTVPYANLTGAGAGSFTGSGFTDVVASNGTNIAVLVNDGAANFSASYPTLTLASSTPLFAVADANGDGYADIYTATSTNGSLQLAANVTTGSATATSRPFSLGIGTKAVSATWSGNVNLLASTLTGQQVVTGTVSATAVTSSKNPSTVGDSVTFTANVASLLPGENIPTGAIVLTDGTTTLASGTLDGNGSFSYTTTALTQATHLIKATYAGDAYFAASISPVVSQIVNHAPAVASNLTWATPAAIVYGTALSGTQLNAAAVDATGVVIPGTFAYTPAAGTVLDAGAKVLSVTFTPTDLLSFLPATKTVTLTVSQAAPVLTWATPASIAYGIPLSATQLNASAVGVMNAALPGTYTYSPVSGTVLAPGTQTLSVSFVPTNAVDYTNATGSVKLLVTGVTVSSFTPNTANIGDPATKITLTGAGFVSTSVVQVNGTAIVTTLVNATTLTAIVPASDFLKPGTLQITVADPGAGIVSPALTLTVNALNIGATITAPPTTPPGSQPTITVVLTQPYPVDLTVTLNLSFASSTTPQITQNQQLQLACQDAASNCVLNVANDTLTFIVPANTTTVPVVLLQAGTIAGTITVPITLAAGGVDVTPPTLAPAVIIVPPAVPSVSGISVTRSGNQLTVVMHGFSNTREVVNAKFHFTAAPGATLGTEDFTLPAGTIFNTDWFDTTQSDQYGSTFTYTQIFNTSDSATNIGSVDATLTNTVGPSTSTTAK